MKFIGDEWSPCVEAGISNIVHNSFVGEQGLARAGLVADCSVLTCINFRCDWYFLCPVFTHIYTTYHNAIEHNTNTNTHTINDTQTRTHRHLEKHAHTHAPRKNRQTQTYTHLEKTRAWENHTNPQTLKENIQTDTHT